MKALSIKLKVFKGRLSISEMEKKLKIVALILGLILAFVAIGWTVYLSYSDPKALPSNAVLLFIISIVAILLISYSQSKD